MNFNPMISHSMKVTSFHAGGSSTNIIPGKATFTIDMRAQSNELMEEMTKRLENTASLLSEYHNISIKLTLDAAMKAAVVSDEARSIIEGAIRESLGEKALKPMITTTGGDDFHYYTIKRPELKASMLAIGCNLQPGLHHPNMRFNLEMIPVAVKILLKTIEKTLTKNG